MAVTDWKSPGTVVDDSTIGLATWSNPDNAKTSNNAVAAVHNNVSIETIYSHYLKATNFGFNIPSGATIDGIQISIEMYCGYDFGDQPTENRVRIVKSDGSIGTTERATGAVIPAPEDTVLYGGSSDVWGETWAYSDINDTDFGIVFSGVMYPDPFGQSISVDHIQIRVYYTESGTSANAERGLYIAGYDTSNSTRGLYLQGSLTSDSTRGLYIEGFVDTLYSRESSASLKAGDSNLSIIFSEQDYTDVATDDDTFVDLEGTAQYFQLLFKEPNGNENNTDVFTVTWKGKSTLAPSSSAVYLQIYNRTTESWTTLVSNSSASANVEFTLEDTVSTDLSDYYDVNYIISVRVYQDGVV